MKKNLVYLLLAFVFASSFVLPSCKKDHSSFPLTDTTLKNISYGNNPANNLDLLLPSNRTKNTKVVIVIHGGGWNAGDKSELSFIAQGLKQRGFAVANVNYRLSPQSNDNYKMQLDDIDNVVGYLNQNASFYTFSKQSIYITGHSAGAHLSLSYAYTRNAGGKIKAVAGMATPTNLFTGATANLGIVGATTITPYLGGPLNSASEQRYKDASPFYHVSKSTVPTILFQGDIDVIVPKDQAVSLADALNKNGVANKLIIYPSVFHDWWANQSLVKNTLDETAAWFNGH